MSKSIIKLIDGYDRESEERAEATFSGCDTYAVAGLEDRPGKRIPKAGARCEAGIGRVRLVEGPLDAEFKGPNVSVGAEANVFGVEAMARAEVGSVSTNVGPIGAKLGLSADTGVSAGADGVEVKLLGTGFKFGPETSVSVFGSELSCSVM